MQAKDVDPHKSGSLSSCRAKMIHAMVKYFGYIFGHTKCDGRFIAIFACIKRIVRALLDKAIDSTYMGGGGGCSILSCRQNWIEQLSKCTRPTTNRFSPHIQQHFAASFWYLWYFVVKLFEGKHFCCCCWWIYIWNYPRAHKQIIGLGNRNS